MSKENKKTEGTIKEKIDLLKNILASEADIDLFEKVEEVNKKFYTALDNLKEARPVFANCDKAFTSVLEKLLRNFELVYGLLEAQYRGEVEREIALLEAVNERIVPFYWETKWLHKPRQNYAATLVDMEADEVMKKVFGNKEREIAEKYLKKPPKDPNASEEEEFEIVGGLGEDPTGEPENAPQGAEQAKGGEEVAPAQESAQGAESAPQATYEEAVKKAAKKVYAKFENAEKKKKGAEFTAENLKNASVSDSERDADKNDGEKVEVLAENAPESVSETVQEAKTPPKGARRRKSKKGEEENECKSDSA